MSWPVRQRKRIERVETQADELVREFGLDAYLEVCLRIRGAESRAAALAWRRIPVAVARKTGERRARSSARRAIDADFSADRESEAEPVSAFATTIESAKPIIADLAKAECAALTEPDEELIGFFGLVVYFRRCRRPDRDLAMRRFANEARRRQRPMTLTDQERTLAFLLIDDNPPSSCLRNRGDRLWLLPGAYLT